ncbi:hypothetical protein CAPTEDRAFT_209560 [Capitella teleta]|uniref:GPR180-like N-terminal domain-containing protein n=1 Tax=Capitella teleta TaxID=283909 RepID=R7UBW5_CAPTE|nr:hypothetical protein CAPTEDRAFT_209560 [Capitella teleta]|eukprot:ELU03865.1 hypothetical protein CAPTEDRAFT_209560 [Capitella teleta]
MGWTVSVFAVLLAYLPIACPLDGNLTSASDPFDHVTEIGTNTTLVVGTEVSTEAVFPYDVTKSPCADATKCTFTVNRTEEGATEEGEDRSPVHSSKSCLIKGRLHYSKNWYGYLATFRLRAENAILYYKFEYPEENCCVKMLLYLQEQKNMLRHRMNCQQKEAIAGTGAQVILLSPAHQESGCRSNSSSDSHEIQCSSGRELRSNVVRDWFIAVSSCGSPIGLRLKYAFQAYGHIGPCPIRERRSTATTLKTSFLATLIWVFILLS